MSPVVCGELRAAIAALLLFPVAAIAQQQAKPNPADNIVPEETAIKEVSPKLQVDANALYEKAVALESSNSKAAIRMYLLAARQGSRKAAVRLGEIYDKGLLGATRNYAESMRWYETGRTPNGTPLIGDFGRPGPNSR